MKRRLFDFFTNEISEKAGFISKDGDFNPLVTGLEYDSRNITNGNLFFALQGLHTNGSLYIEDAIKKGASVIVHENDVYEQEPEVVYIKVKNSRFAMSPISAAFYDFPSMRMLVTGVTGTEGKSTTVYLIWQLLTLLGKKAGFFSTVQYCVGSEVMWNSEHQTTPEAPVVQRLLYEMADNGCEFAVVEASSHGLSKLTNRLGDVEFCSAVITNMTHEHLEFHGTWEQYRDDKANLFRALDDYKQKDNSSFNEPFGIVNANDKSSMYFENQTNQKILKFSVGGDADIAIKAIESTAWGNWYLAHLEELNEYIDLRDKLPGAYNSGNVLAAILTISGLLKMPVREIAPYIKYLKPVMGRMSSIEKGQPFEVIVDYAHTPSSFKTILQPLRNRINKSGGRIISLFGSAGERDTQKRAEQGKIAAEYSDIIVLTDEDPRGEAPEDILEEIVKGIIVGNTFPENIDEMRTNEKNHVDFIHDKNLFLVPERPAAIRKALSLAEGRDIVILMGKGHENSIIYADHVMPYNEIAEVEKALSEMQA